MKRIPIFVLFLTATLALAQPLPPLPPGLSTNSAKALVISTNGVLSVSNPAPSVILTWTASADPAVSGYNLFWGAASRSYTNVLDAGNKLSATVTNLAFNTTYYYACTAYDTNGLQSVYSNEVTNTTPVLPVPPGNFALLSVLASASPNGPWYASGTLPAYIGLTNAAQFFTLQIARVAQ